jgi:hypothetical protein
MALCIPERASSHLGLQAVGCGDPNKIAKLEKGLPVCRLGMALGTALCIVCKATAGKGKALSVASAQCIHFGWGS